MIRSDPPRYTGWNDLLRSWLNGRRSTLFPARSGWNYQLVDDLLLDGAHRVVALRTKSGAAFYRVDAFRHRTWADRERLESYGLRPLMPHEFAGLLFRVGVAHGEGPKDIDEGDPYALKFVEHWTEKRGAVEAGTGFSWRAWRVQAANAGLVVAYPLVGALVSLVVARFTGEACEVSRTLHRRSAALWTRDAVYCAVRRRPPLTLLVGDPSGGTTPKRARCSSPCVKSSYVGFSNLVHRWARGELPQEGVRARGNYELRRGTLVRGGIPVAARILGRFYYALPAFHARWELRTALEREGFTPLMGFEFAGLLSKGMGISYSAYEEWRGDGTVLAASRAWVARQGRPIEIKWRSTRVRFEEDSVSILTSVGWKDVALRGAAVTGDGGSDLVINGNITLPRGRNRGKAYSFLQDAIYRSDYLKRQTVDCL